MRRANQAARQHTYYWVTGRVDGKLTLLGPYDTEEDADEQGFKGFKNSPYSIHPLRTRNKASATSALKHELFNESEDLPGSLQPVRHKI